MVGNHDTYYRDRNDVHNLHFIEHLPNVKIITDYEVHECEGKKIGYCAWLTSQNEEEIYAKMKAEKVDYLFGHFELQGFAFNKL